MSADGSLIGKVFANYHIIGELGRGGMGVVYKAHEMSLRREVALKLLPNHLAMDRGFVKRFIREARAAAQLNHPRLVTVHAVGQHEGKYYIAMEFVKGKSLAVEITESGRLDVKRAMVVVRQAADALAEAHGKNVIHRDIKPQNIMIDEAGRVKVMDFGLARVALGSSELTTPGSSLGTPAYMSPEQCEGEALDGRTDIYSLGVTLYEMLTGQTPFSAGTPTGLMYQIVNAPFPNVLVTAPDVPPEVERILSDMVEKNPVDRYLSADSLRADLDAWLRGLDVSRADTQFSPGKSESLAQGRRLPASKPRSRFKWAAIGVIVALAICGLGAATTLLWPSLKEFAATIEGSIGKEVAKPALEPSAAPPPDLIPERTVRFPDDSVGRLDLLTWSPVDWDRDWASAYSLTRIPYGSADKKVLVDAGKYLGLTLSPDGATGLSFLDNVNQDDLQGLHFARVERGDASLVHLAHLKGLRFLELDRAGITDAGLFSLKDLDSLTLLVLDENPIVGGGLSHLSRLGSLEILYLRGTRLNDLGLPHLSALSSLKLLDLAFTQVTDEGIEHLSVLESLRSLNLCGTRLTGTGLEHLRELTSLKSLDLRRTFITDAAMVNVGELTSLEDLVLLRTGITDDGLSHLGGLESLERFVLAGTAVTDAGLAYIAGLTSLKTLDLQFTGITDEGMHHLKKIGSLEELYVARTAVTAGGVNALKQELPLCVVDF